MLDPLQHHTDAAGLDSRTVAHHLRRDCGTRSAATFSARTFEVFLIATGHLDEQPALR